MRPSVPPNGARRRIRIEFIPVRRITKHRLMGAYIKTILYSNFPSEFTIVVDCNNGSVGEKNVTGGLKVERWVEEREEMEGEEKTEGSSREEGRR